ncbi:MAG: hypothetical protein DWQ04_11135 [Chloroflexi bacterium]|nr:MAG: hypothetical protein DWQ04_11135 [Chloroflexota bacterium]
MKHPHLPQNKLSTPPDPKQSVWGKAYFKLTAPHPSITNPRAKREAQLLAIMLVFTIVTTVIAIPSIQKVLPTLKNFVIIILALEVFGYLFSRTRYYRAGLIILISLLSGSISYSVNLQEEFTQFHLMAGLAWLVLPIILASIFFDLRIVLVLITFIITNLLFLPFINSNITLNAISQVFFFVLTAAGLILLLTRHISKIDEDRMASLIEQQEKLKQSNRELQQEIQERLLAEKALEQAHHQLEQRVEERTAELAKSNKDLETLLYVISHDLKEPLRSIRFFSEMVSQRYAHNLDDKGQDWLRRINRGGARLQSIIADILTLSRIRRVELTLEWIEGIEVIEEAIERLEERISETKAKITIDPTIPQVYANPQWATQAIYNLISNALKFNRNNQHPIIEINAYHNQGESGIVVRDRGIGISEENCERIFQLFERGVGKEIEGTGAGLAIVKQIAERHLGHAWAQARPGGGSDFFVTFAHNINHEF